MNISQFERKKEYLICVDSDGCAMDTMDIKHKQCFGPCMIKEWKLEQWKEAVLQRWNEINLYSMTRGINRFKGLATMLEEVDQKYTHIEGLEELKRWVDTSVELSNSSLKEMISKGGGEILKKALDWSVAVNLAIDHLPWESKKAFSGVRESFEMVRNFADIVVVSSANREAVEEEWERFGLLPLVDLILCQDIGSKEYCISEMKKKGYGDRHILMVGDAPGDKKAAEKNNVYYYPILAGKEAQSWHQFSEAAELFKKEEYGEYGRKKAQEFLSHLSVGHIV